LPHWPVNSFYINTLLRHISFNIKYTRRHADYEWLCSSKYTLRIPYLLPISSLEILISDNMKIKLLISESIWIYIHLEMNWTITIILLISTYIIAIDVNVIMWKDTRKCEHWAGKQKKTEGVYIYPLQIRKKTGRVYTRPFFIFLS
jgi:hypothetical protein